MCAPTTATLKRIWSGRAAKTIVELEYNGKAVQAVDVDIGSKREANSFGENVPPAD